MFIFDANRYAKDPGGVSSRVNQMIEDLGGTVRASRLWNEQKLAYTINGHRKGTYWLTYFRIEPTKIGELNRACQLNDNILRHLVLKIDPRLEETMVAHALGKSTSADTKQETAPAVPAAEEKADASKEKADASKEEKAEASKEEKAEAEAVAVKD